MPALVERRTQGHPSVPLLIDGEAGDRDQRNLSFGTIMKIGANVLECDSSAARRCPPLAADDGGLRLQPAAADRTPEGARIEVPGEPKRGERVRLAASRGAVIPSPFGVVMVR